MIACGQPAIEVGSEARLPARRCAVPGVARDLLIVDDVPARDDQHAFLAQRCQPRRERIVECRRLRAVDRELDDRDVGGRECVRKHGPRAVIEPPALVDLDRCRREQLAHAQGERGFTRRGVVEREQLRTITAEVVDGSRMRRTGHARRTDVPVRRDDQDRTRLLRCAERGPRLGIPVPAEDVVGVAVADERDRKRLEGRHARSFARKRRLAPSSSDDLRPQGFVRERGVLPPFVPAKAVFDVPRHDVVHLAGIAAVRVLGREKERDRDVPGRRARDQRLPRRPSYAPGSARRTGRARARQRPK
jgi:hypothetical protein